MSYNRLIFYSEDAYMKWLRSDRSQCDELNRDINAEAVTNSIKLIDRDFPEQYVLYPCSDRATANMRFEVFRELHANAEYNEKLYDFMPCLSRADKLRALSTDAVNSDQQQYYWLTAIRAYVSAVYGLYALLCEGSVKSDALVRLKSMLKEKIDDADFQAMRDKADMLNADFEKILEITLAFNYSMSVVKIEQGHTNSFALGNLTEKYLGFSLAPEYSIVNSNPITSMEEELIAYFKRQNPALFQRMDEFYREYRKKINIHEITDLRPHIGFYTIYTKFILKLERQGYTFTIPEFGEGFHARNAYDLGLAVKHGNAAEVVTNDIDIPKGNIFVLSGPNQGGKTTYIRSIALTALLACNGCYVPCESCTVPYYDRIFAHFNRSEVLGKGGRLEEELTRVREILSALTPNSFVLFNECFASTRRADGVKLSLKLLDRLFKSGCSGGFVTHYYEISDYDERIITLVAGVATEGENNDIRTYKITPCKPSDNAYADTIARQCGVTFDQLEVLINEHKKVQSAET